MLSVSLSVSPVHQIFLVLFGRLRLWPPSKKGINESHCVGPRLPVQRSEKRLLCHARKEMVKYGLNLNNHLTEKRRATQNPLSYSGSIHRSRVYYWFTITPPSLYRCVKSLRYYRKLSLSQIRSGCRLEEENLYLPRSDPQFVGYRACVLVTARKADLFSKKFIKFTHFLSNHTADSLNYIELIDSMFSV
jgi:hypothetical protein